MITPSGRASLRGLAHDVREIRLASGIVRGQAKACHVAITELEPMPRVVGDGGVLGIEADGGAGEVVDQDRQ